MRTQNNDCLWDLSHVYSSPHIVPQRRCSCPLCSMTPIVSGPSFLLPSQALKILSSGKRSENLLQGWQEQPQICFQKMLRRHLLGEKGLYSDLFQKAEGQQQGGTEGHQGQGPIAQPNSSSSTGHASKGAPISQWVLNISQS